MATSKMAQKSKFLNQMRSWTSIVEKETEEENKMKKRPAGATGEDTKVLKRPGAEVETLELGQSKDRNKDGWHKRNVHFLLPDMHSPLLLVLGKPHNKTKQIIS